jgi:hypothetical protein
MGEIARRDVRIVDKGCERTQFSNGIILFVDEIAYLFTVSKLLHIIIG